MSTPVQKPSWSSIPNDIAFKIISFLEGWREGYISKHQSLGTSVSIMKEFVKLCTQNESLEVGHYLEAVRCLHSYGLGFKDFQMFLFSKAAVLFLIWLDYTIVLRLEIPGWREGYISKHQSLGTSVSIMKGFVKQCTQNESLEVGHYLEAVRCLHSYGLGFKDVQMFLFSKSCSALLNLVGLHYCLLRLEIPPGEVAKALSRSQVSEREICVRWFKLGRWFFGFRLPDEQLSRNISLGELAMDKGDEVLRVLNRGAVHEVIRVHIAPANPRPSCSRIGSDN